MIVLSKRFGSMASAPSAMMTSIALTGGSPALPPALMPSIGNIRLAALYDSTRGRTTAGGISVSEKPSPSESAGPDESITVNAWEKIVEQTIVKAADLKYRRYRDLIDKVWGYTSLPDNWDNDQGRAPQIKTAFAALEFLQRAFAYAKPPRSFVVGDGEIGFSWESNAGYAQIAFHDDGEIVVIARTADGQRDLRGAFKAFDVTQLSQLKEIISTL
jgi:hypothetical protein